jgi:hypothetical protein
VGEWISEGSVHVTLPGKRRYGLVKHKETIKFDRVANLSCKVHHGIDGMMPHEMRDLKGRGRIKGANQKRVIAMEDQA